VNTYFNYSDNYFNIRLPFIRTNSRYLSKLVQRVEKIVKNGFNWGLNGQQFLFDNQIIIVKVLETEVKNSEKCDKSYSIIHMFVCFTQ